MKRITIFLLWILSAVFGPATQAYELYITTGFTPPVSDYFHKVLEEIDRRSADISIEFEVLPAERSVQLVSRGVNDAECCRIIQVMESSYPNLIPIKESFYSARFSAFSVDPEFKASSFDDLKPYRVATVKGWKITVDQMNRVQPAEHYVLNSGDQLFQMLDARRIDVGLFGYLSGLQVIKNLEFYHIQAVQPPLADLPLHLMLHPKHKDIMPTLDQIIAGIKEDGTADEIYQSIIASLLDSQAP